MNWCFSVGRGTNDTLRFPCGARLERPDHRRCVCMCVCVWRQLRKSPTPTPLWTLEVFGDLHEAICRRRSARLDRRRSQYIWRPLFQRKGRLSQRGPSEPPPRRRSSDSQGCRQHRRDEGEPVPRMKASTRTLPLNSRIHAITQVRHYVTLPLRAVNALLREHHELPLPLFRGALVFVKCILVLFIFFFFSSSCRARLRLAVAHCMTPLHAWATTGCLCRPVYRVN